MFSGLLTVSGGIFRSWEEAVAFPFVILVRFFFFAY